MSCGKCWKTKGLCPVSFGFALGITCALATLIWSLWVMNYGMPPGTMMGHMVPPANMGGVWSLTGWSLLKGFLFGFVFAWIYDLISCCCKARCCRKQEGMGCGCGSKSDGCGCGCGCKSCGTGNKPV